MRWEILKNKDYGWRYKLCVLIMGDELHSGLSASIYHANRIKEHNGGFNNLETFNNQEAGYIVRMARNIMRW